MSNCNFTDIFKNDCMNISDLQYNNPDPNTNNFTFTDKIGLSSPVLQNSINNMPYVGKPNTTYISPSFSTLCPTPLNMIGNINGIIPQDNRINSTKESLDKKKNNNLGELNQDRLSLDSTLQPSYQNKINDVLNHPSMLSPLKNNKVAKIVRDMAPIDNAGNPLPWVNKCINSETIKEKSECVEEVTKFYNCDKIKKVLPDILSKQNNGENICDSLAKTLSQGEEAIEIGGDNLVAWVVDMLNCTTNFCEDTYKTKFDTDANKLREQLEDAFSAKEQLSTNNGFIIVIIIAVLILLVSTHLIF